MKTATVRLVFGVLMAAALATGCASSRYPANAKLKTGSGPLVQAHRGGRAEYDDNALGGFEMCLSRGIKGFELDVRYTTDCVLVVMHDESLARTTTGEGNVEDTTFSDLCKLRLKKSSEQVPALSEVHNNADFDTRKRTIRAIEIAEYQKTNAAQIPDFPKIDSIIIGVRMEREAVCQSIYNRLKQRLRDGMIDEIQALLDSGIPPEDLMYYGLEYKFVTQFLMKEFSYNYMVEHLNIAIHQFAKRQMTWFRRMERNGFKINWIDGTLPLEEKVAKAMEILNGYYK